MRIDLQHDEYAAQIDTEGAALCSLSHRGRELLLRVTAAVPTPPYAGLVLAPWPNRIAGGRYRFAGLTHQLPITEIETGTALHGLVLWERFEVVSSTGSAVTLRCEPVPRPGYPFRIRVEVTYQLAGSGLAVGVSATNLGSEPAPVGLATHPYLTAGAGPLDEWTLELPCAEVMDVDDRLLPRAVVPAGDRGLDFTSPRRLGDAEIDHAFRSTAFTAGGTTSCRLLAPDGHGVELQWDRRSPWVQVYTMHAPGQPWHRRAVAVEPMTCAPDAFNTGTGLIVLAPEETTGMGWRAEAI